VPRAIGRTRGGALLYATLVCTLFVQRAWAADDCGCLPCDFDQDGDVDMADFGHLQACLSGYGVSQTDSACWDTRLAGHLYVDGQDVAIFRACLGGEQRPFAGSDLPDAVISEFMAANNGGLLDEDGDDSDWIEIFNPCRPSLDLSGWYLTDTPNNLQKWAFPAMSLVRGQYLVVFASGKDRRTPGQNLHTNFQLESNGEYLALVSPGGQVVAHGYVPEFPEQLTNVSYGLAQGSVTALAKGALAAYHVPTPADAGLGTSWTATDFPDSAWSVGPTGLGFSSVPATFQLTTYKAKAAVSNLAAAEAVIADPSKQAWTATGQVPTLNLLNTGPAGHYVGDQAFPGVGASAVDDFVLLATGTLVIPTAGEWTFGVSSDEGFSLTLTHGSRVYAASYPEPREATDTLSVFSINEPGIYTLRLVHFQHTGGAEVELFAARGYYVMFDPEVFRLVGDVAGGGLTLGGLGVDVFTNLSAVMPGVNSSVWIRAPFDLDNAAFYTSMKLRMRYVDGFVAYLNGEEIARRNAPATPAWNSAATAVRTGQAAASTEEIDLSGFQTLLRAGRNLLAIQGLNNSVADGDFAMVPELVLSSNSMQPQYFATATPGTPNVAGALDFVRSLSFDQPHGFRGAAFLLILSCATPGADIRYTLDGSTPTAATGLVYTGPLTISQTSVVRAAGFRTGWLPSAVTTRTYLFVNDIVQQSPQGQKPGPGWPDPGTLIGQVIDYGMDPDIVNSASYSSLMDDALLSIPSISLVTDLPNLFSTTTGIYTHAGNDGMDWERPCSVELINPDGIAGFQIDAGLRIRGGYSRNGGDPKHSFRLIFRAEYGQKELDYPLFETEGVDKFKKIDLQTNQSFSWNFSGDPLFTQVRDVAVRDSQGAMGEPYTRSRYYHLYLDGHYWGLYLSEERPEADFAASYFGGTDADYDVVKLTWGPFTVTAGDGNLDAWYRLWQACNAGFASDEAYYKVLGLNVDGTRNPAYEVLVDVDNTIDATLVTYWSGDTDGFISAYLGNNGPNNFYALRNRDGQSGFKSFKRDCEAALLQVGEDRTGPWWGGSAFSYFNTQYLSQCLASNAEYRMRFGDRVQKFMFNGGALTPEKSIARLMARANQIQTAIIAESARWGDAKVHPPRNRDNDWWPQINGLVTSYFPARNAIVLDQLKADGLYPTVPAPLFTSYGGQVQAGAPLRLSQPAGANGTIYYTTDGTDPRLRGGAVAPGAQIFSGSASNVTLLPAGSVWRYLDNGSNQGTGWVATGFPDTGWAQGPAQLGYSPDEHDEATTVGYGPDANNKYATTYFRKSFTVPAGVTCTGLTFRMVCDDGAAVYLNGHTPATTSTMPPTWDFSTYCGPVADETAWVNYALNPADLNIGNNNVLAAEVHQYAPNSSDLSFDLELTATLDSSQPILIDHNMTVKTRILDNGQWSALVEAVFVTQPVGLVINEFMADNASTIQDPDEPGEYPDWIEIYNPNPNAISMAGMYLSDEIVRPTKFKIASGVSIPANGYLVFWADDDGTQGNLHTTFNLSKGGEHIQLTAADGTTVIDQIVFGAQTTDVSYGRYPNGGATWGQMVSPTPGAANGPLR
jgi:hypothetical protein